MGGIMGQLASQLAVFGDIVKDQDDALQPTVAKMYRRRRVVDVVLPPIPRQQHAMAGQ
ncbi:MAG: hypothetical protein AW07_02226 [Candidatus Accumulibacter sp. SK-11]|nr:MAG: hypothetical protein AW07_02226 [Candidatus Accumulibacter sp. SK-11]